MAPRPLPFPLPVPTPWPLAELSTAIIPVLFGVTFGLTVPMGTAAAAALHAASPAGVAGKRVELQPTIVPSSVANKKDAGAVVGVVLHVGAGATTTGGVPAV